MRMRVLVVLGLALLFHEGNGRLEADAYLGLPPGLVSWWSGENHVKDLCGANHGVIHGGVTFAEGRIGQAMSFDGKDGYVSFGNAVGNFGKNDFAISFWIRKTSSRTEGMLGKRVSCGSGSFWDIRPTSATCMELCESNPSQWSGATGTLNNGAWHHVALVRQGLKLRTYHNGRLAVTVTTPAVVDLSNSAELCAGRSACTGSGDGTAFFTGQLDEIRIYNRALTDIEVKALSNP